MYQLVHEDGAADYCCERCLGIARGEYWRDGLIFYLAGGS